MPQQIVGALGQIPRRKLMTIGGGIAIGILFLIGMVVLSGCDSKPQEQLDAEVAALQVASCPTGLAFYDELEQPICWMPGFQVYPNQTDPPCEYYGSGYIHVDLETFEPKEGPYADPPPGCVPGDEAVAQTETGVTPGIDPATGLPEPEPTPRPTPEWQAPPSGELASEIQAVASQIGVQPQWSTVQKVILWFVSVLLAIYVIADARERRQIWDGIASVAGSLLNFWVGAYLQQKVLMGEMEVAYAQGLSIGLFLTIWVTLIVFTLTGGVDYTSLGGAMALTGIGIAIRGNLGLIGLALSIESFPVLDVLKTYAYVTSGVAVVVKTSVISYGFLLVGAFFLLCEVLMIQDFLLLIKGIRQQNKPNWASLAAAIVAFLGYPIARIAFPAWHPYLCLFIAASIGIIVSTFSRRFGTGVAQLGANPQQIVAGFSPYIPWDGQALAVTVLAFCILVTGKF
ncbi:hypothetical protein KBC79_04255 [Candidatus Woesebacteria bacterium]|nr:hypothetical protein [Candidatus Woesebacteria bacterium]